MNTDIISTNDAAEILGVTPRRVLAMIQQGQIPALKMGRFHVLRRADLALVADRKPGRPPTAEKKPVAKQRTKQTKAGKAGHRKR